jgi:hypothetical protein
MYFKRILVKLRKQDNSMMKLVYQSLGWGNYSNFEKLDLTLSKKSKLIQKQILFFFTEIQNISQIAIFGFTNRPVRGLNHII